MIAPSSLRLEYYFVQELSFSALLDHANCEEATKSKFLNLESNEVEVKSEFAEAEGNPLQHRIVMTIIGKKENNPLPFKLCLHGYFSLSEEFAKNKNARDILCVNGGSILYTAARELLLTITSRGPFGPIFLPTVRLLGKNDDIKAIEETPKKQ